MVEVLRFERVDAERDLPLELAITGEQQVLEDALQVHIAVALAVNDEEQYPIKIDELDRIISALRPYRVAHERTRIARRLIHRAVPTPIGPAIVTDLGERMVQAAEVLDPSSPVLEAVNVIDSAYEVAADKAARFKLIRGRLEDNEARPAVTVALG